MPTHQGPWPPKTILADLLVKTRNVYFLPICTLIPPKATSALEGGRPTNLVCDESVSIQPSELRLKGNMDFGKNCAHSFLKKGAENIPFWLYYHHQQRRRRDKPVFPRQHPRCFQENLSRILVFPFFIDSCRFCLKNSYFIKTAERMATRNKIRPSKIANENFSAWQTGAWMSAKKRCSCQHRWFFSLLRDHDLFPKKFSNELIPPRRFLSRYGGLAGRDLDGHGPLA